jgi:hypothetical protein
MADLARDRYVAGLWRKDIVRQLCWMQTERQRLRPLLDVIWRREYWTALSYRAPSWSWAALDLMIQYPEFDMAEDISEIFSSNASPQILDVRTTCAGLDQFGGVSDGSIRLRGTTVAIEPFQPTEFIILPMPAPVYRQEFMKRVRIMNRVGQAVGLIVLERANWTLGLVRTNHCGMIIKCLRMWTFQEQSINILEDDNESWQCKLIGLALRPVEDEGTYERIGMVYFFQSAGERFFEDEGIEEEITLI